jgi:hypothetical protein
MEFGILEKKRPPKWLDVGYKPRCSYVYDFLNSYSLAIHVVNLPFYGDYFRWEISELSIWREFLLFCVFSPLPGDSETC